jgi:hypothetical protein
LSARREEGAYEHTQLTSNAAIGSHGPEVCQPSRAAADPLDTTIPVFT